jgi:hypothetical protein
VGCGTSPHRRLEASTNSELYPAEVGFRRGQGAWRLASLFRQHDVAGFRFQAGVSVRIGLAFRNVALAQVAEMAEQPTKPGPTRIERSHNGLQEMRAKQY